MKELQRAIPGLLLVATLILVCGAFYTAGFVSALRLVAP